MSQTSIDTSPGGQIAVLVTFSWGDPVQYARYIGWTSDLVIGSETFLSEPLLEVSLPEKGFGTKDKDGKVTLGALRSPFDRILTGYKHAPVTIKIEQIDPLDTSTRRVLHIGPLGIATKNPSGRRGLASAVVMGIKSRLAEASVGFAMTTTCQNTFGDVRCRANAEDWNQEGTVASIGFPNRNSITLNLPEVSVPGAELPDERFRGGIINIAGLPLRIKKSYGNKTFDLHALPPPWCVGEPAKVFAGCDKRHETCEQVWLNEPNFNGLGIKTPDRNPSFEEG